jgi:hypothetical protein
MISLRATDRPHLRPVSFRAAEIALVARVNSVRRLRRRTCACDRIAARACIASVWESPPRTRRSRRTRVAQRDPSHDDAKKVLTVKPLGFSFSPT